MSDASRHARSADDLSKEIAWRRDDLVARLGNLRRALREAFAVAPRVRVLMTRMRQQVRTHPAPYLAGAALAGFTLAFLVGRRR
jgi:ElaB/YqjD/DUF883 family membrane-anchored ribosome-binding protein